MIAWLRSLFVKPERPHYVRDSVVRIQEQRKSSEKQFAVRWDAKILREQNPK